MKNKYRNLFLLFGILAIVIMLCTMDMDYSDIDYQVHDGPLRCGRCAILFLAHGAGILPLGGMACGWIYTGRGGSVRLSGGRPYLDTGPYCRSRSEYGGGIWCRSSS